MTSHRIKTHTWIVVTICSVFFTGAHAEMTVEQFGASIAESLQAGEAERFTSKLDMETLIDRATDDMQGNDEFVAGLRSGLERGLSQVGTILLNNLGPAARLTYVRVRPMEGVPRVLVRVDLGDRGLNYLDFLVHKREDGSWAIYDWLDYVQGQNYTESLKMVLALMVQQNPGLLSRLLGLPEVDTQLAKQIAEMGTLGQQGDWAGWLEMYHELPEKVRNSRVLLTTRVAAAGASGDGDEYMNAMAALHGRYGDDPTLSLALVDYHLLTGDHARAFKAVDRLDEYTGGDAALTNLRAGIALHKGDNVGAVRLARRAISEDPKYEDPYWHLMVAGARAADYKAAMQGVRGLEDRFGYQFSEDELMDSEDFSGLLASKEWNSRE